MTIHQQAHGLIDMLSEESAEAVVQVMLRMLPYDRRPAYSNHASADPVRTAPEQKSSFSMTVQQLSSQNMDPALRSLLASNKTLTAQQMDALSEEVDGFNDELAGFFGTDPSVRKD